MNLSDHMASHLRLDKGVLLLTALLLVIVAVLHFAALAYDDALLLSIVRRAYYLPVLYAALASGMLAAIGSSVLAVGIHLGIMFHEGLQWGSLTIDHGIELIFLIGMAALTGALQDHFRHVREKEKLTSDMFGKYISPEVAQLVTEQDEALQGKEVKATVLFTDLIGFTSLSEKLAAKELLALLNDYFEGMIQVALRHDGYINKFIGDALMVLYDVPIVKGDAEKRAVDTAIEMQHQLQAFNQRHGLAGVELGLAMGIHTGDVVAGNLGSQERKEFTVLGDTVNLASRVEGLARKYNSDILITDTTLKAIQGEEGLLAREVDAVRVKGRKQPVVLYEVYNCCSEEERRLKTDTLPEFLSALNFYKAGNWEEAEQLFDSVLRQYPNDATCKTYLERIRILERVPPQNWDGVFDYFEK